jgi:hypothetical protein
LYGIILHVWSFSEDKTIWVVCKKKNKKPNVRKAFPLDCRGTFVKGIILTMISNNLMSKLLAILTVYVDFEFYLNSLTRIFQFRSFLFARAQEETNGLLKV